MKLLFFLICIQTAVATIQHAPRRKLGDFDRFNSLFENSSIIIEDDFVVSQKILFTTLVLNIHHIQCSNIAVGNIAVSHDRKSEKQINVGVDVSQLDIQCTVYYRYEYGFIKGDGAAIVLTDDNALSTKLNFESQNFDNQGPSSSSVESCATDIRITSIDFHGDTLSDVIEIAESMIKDIIETELEKVACDELGSLGTSFVSDMLGIAGQTLEPYKGNLGEEVNDPMYLERNTALPADLVPLNLQDTENIIGDWFNQALNEADALLGSVVPDPDGPHPEKQDLGVNILLRSHFLDENRALVVDVTQLPIDTVLFKGHDQITETTITLNSIKVLGLDSFEKFNALMDIGKFTLQNELTWKKLSIEFDVTVNVMPSSRQDAILQDATSEGISERITVNFGVENTDIVASLFLVIDQDALGSMELGPLLTQENWMPCILSVIHKIQLSGMHVNPMTVNVPTMRGFVSPGIDRIVSDSVRAAFSMYEGVLREAIPNIFQTSIRDFINREVIDAYIASPTRGDCPDAQEAQGLIDFRDLFLTSEKARALGGSGLAKYGNVFQMIYNFLQDTVLKVDSSSGRSALNDMIFTQFTKSGSLLFPGDLFGGGSRVRVGGLDANVKVKASDARVDNLDTVGSPLALLQPVMDQPYELNNTAAFGADDRPLRFAVRFLISLMDDDDMQLENDVEISLDLNSVSVMLLTMMKVAESKLYSFPLRDITDFNCWLATIPAPFLDSYGLRAEGLEPTAQLKEMVVSVANLNLNVSCIECSSPRMSEFTEILSTAAAQEGLAQSVNNLLDSVTKLVGGNFLQVQIDRYLNDAARKCPHSPLYEENAKDIQYEAFEAPNNNISTSFLLMLSAIAGSLIAVALFLSFVIRCFVRRRHSKWLKSLPPHQVQRLKLEQHREEKEESELNAATKSMFSSPHVPLFVRLSMPLIIIGNIGFFLSGHLSLGATVNIEAELAGEKIHVDNFFEFSMARSTVDIWNAGGKELAIMILVFSGIWPYTKQLITLVLWFLPPSKCSVSRRESILLWLDCLGKWSMIDIFVLVISIAAFRVSILSPQVMFLPEDFYSLDLLVVPLWGLYANMIAQLISQVSSHYIIYYHRNIVQEAHQARKLAKQSDDAIMDGNKNNIKVHCSSMDESVSSSGSEDTARIALHQHRFGRPHRGETDKLVVRPWVNKMLLGGAFCLMLCVVVGCAVPSFSLEILGIIGVAVESGQDFEAAATHHSVFTVVELLLEEAEFLGTIGDYVGLGTLSMLFVFTVLLVPIIQAIALLRQWFSPSSREQKVRMSVIIEILQAWQYAEVYLIAIFVASWQLGPISEFMINSYCESLKDTFAELVHYGLLKEEDAQCFSVKSSIENGSYILVIGAILLALLNTFVSKAVAQYFRDKKEEKNLILGESTEFVLNGNDTDQGTESSTDSHTRIHPVPVLFTDSFRWLLLRDDARVGSNSFHAAFGNQKITSRFSNASATANDVESNNSSIEEGPDEGDSSSAYDSSAVDNFEDEDEDESGWTSVEEDSTHHSNSVQK